MSYYQELDLHVTEKVKVVLTLSNYATKNELNDAADILVKTFFGENILFNC